MGIQYKPTKQKKEKPVKAPKAPKADKPMKMGGAVKVKSSKPAKAPKQPKAPKPEKAVSFAPTKVEKAEQFKGAGKLKKPIPRGVWIGIIVAAVLLVAAVALAIFLPDNEIDPIAPSMMTIETMPDKTTYFVGEEFSAFGIKIKVTLNNGTTYYVNSDICEFSGFDSSKPAENQVIIVKYKNLQTSFNIVVKKVPVIVENKDMVGLSFKTLPKTKYKVGDWMSVDGGVLVVKYDDGSTKEIALTYDHVYGFSTAEAGTFTLYVKHVEEGLLCETTYTITVTE